MVEHIPIIYLTCTLSCTCAEKTSEVYVEVYDRYILGTCLETYTWPQTLINKGI